MAGVTPQMLVRAMYRPAAVIADRSGAGDSAMLVTNILTDKGPVVIEVRTVGAEVRGAPAAVVRSIYPREDGGLPYWINGKDAKRDVLYIDEAQLPEAVTGNLSPENQNATRRGWRVVPAVVDLNGSRHHAGGPTSTSSDAASVANWKAPRNSYYAGLATVQAKLQQRLSGRGMPKARTYTDLLRWIAKHWSGDETDRPVFSRAATALPAPAERAEAIIQTAAGTPKPIDAFARTLARITGLGRLTAATYGMGGLLVGPGTKVVISSQATFEFDAANNMGSGYAQLGYGCGNGGVSVIRPACGTVDNPLNKNAIVVWLGESVPGTQIATAESGFANWSKNPVETGFFAETGVQVNSLPEPSTYALLAVGGAMLYGCRRRFPWSHQLRH